MKRLMALVLGAGFVVVSGIGLAQAQDTKKAEAKPAAKSATKPASAPPAQEKVAAPGDAPTVPPVTDPTLKTMDAQAAYGFGMNIGVRLVDQCTQFQLDPKLVARGIADGLTGAKAAMTDEQIQAVMSEFEKQLLARQMEAEKAQAEQMKALGEKSKKDGDAYLAANKAKQGVKSTATGLQYKVLSAGTGSSPKVTDTVTINYKGKLLDGTVFDTTEGKEPMTFPIEQFIDGWKEALVMMKVGDKYEVVIPPGLAYGEQGTPGGPIPPNSVLVFEIELLDIKAPEQPKP
jgi:FKBP-type peptidyl-prolyl cis-trans isomerase